jgi:predicted transposase/invertase (TIGR01784 family)
MKRSLADLVVEDEDHRKYIIEIERSIQKGFVHKACFNTSRLIVDHVSTGTDFNNIVKVIHISILYFPLEGNEPIYHGETIIRGLESKERLTVHLTDPNTKITVDAINILPEYFFISIPLFDDRLETEIDDWLYVMKHDDVPQHFHSPYMEKVRERLSVLKMTVEERNSYYAYMKEIFTDKDSYETSRELGRMEGRKEGMEKGRAEGKAETAKNLIRMGLSLEQVAQGTELSLDVVQRLAEEIEKE